MLLRYHHQFRTLIAEVVREEYGREVVLAGVEEEALEDHTTRSPSPAAEESPRPRLLEQCLRRMHDAAVRLLGDVALLARLDRIHRVRQRGDDDAAPQSAGHGGLRFTVA